MRPLNPEEREDLVRRSGGLDLLDFVEQLKVLRRKHRVSVRYILAVLLRAPKETDLDTLGSVRNTLAEQGMELTPAELKRITEVLFCRLRSIMREHGVPEDQIPDSDCELLRRLT